MDTVSLREHIEALLREADKREQQRFEAQNLAIDAAMIAVEKAMVEARTASEKRFEGTNEWRATVNDIIARNITRAETDARFEALMEKISLLQQRIDTREGTAGGMKSFWGYLVGAVGLTAAIAALLQRLP